MKIVIDIPEEMISYINKNEFDAISEAVYGSMAIFAIQNGTPLPKGHWEDCSNGWMCSNCNRDVSNESNFCPNCGADMRESEEGE